ncbi:two-component sensor histidine kinase [Phytomonospora endophytica]|nr:two-component sensor histidine kinase [Phytomonospora endophytica]
MSARARLTVLFTGLVLAAGIALIAITHVLVRQSLERRFTVLLLGTGHGDIPPAPDVPSADALRDQVVEDLLTRSAIALTVVTALAALLGWLVAGKVLRPIRTMTATADRLSAEHLDERVPVTAPADELAALATTLNGMLDRVQRGLDAHRMFVANAAHELRTPLATTRTAVDVTLDGDPTREELLAMAADVRVETERSQRTLDGLLVLARAQTTRLRRAPADLAELAKTALPTADAGLTVTTRLEPAEVQGEPALLARMVENLLTNAVRHNKPGGHVDVRTGTEDGTATIRVENTGPLVATEDVDGLFEPFTRGLSAEHPGAGLGLSIVRAIADAHGGDVGAQARGDGGLVLSVRFDAV